MLRTARLLSRLAAPRMSRALEASCSGRPFGLLATTPSSHAAQGHLRSLSLPMSTKAKQQLPSKPAGKRQLLEMPALSTSRERVQKNGLIALTAPYIKQQSEGAKAMETSFRVQTYAVPLHKPAEFALTSVFGFGRVRSKQLAAEAGLFGHYPLSRMRESQRSFIKRKLSNACIAYDDPDAAAGSALQKEIALNIKRLKDIRCYRGVRHDLLLPVRGQRTKTNAKTVRRMKRWG